MNSSIFQLGFFEAVEKNDLYRVRAYLEFIDKKVINAQNDDGDTALIQASYKGYVSIVKDLILVGADLDIQDSDGVSALISASANNNPEIVWLLVNAHNGGAKLNLQNKYGNTAVIYAADGGFTNVARILIEAGADLNIQNINKENAIFRASVHGDNSEILSMFIRATADLAY